jgi:hypothetical protein
MSEFVAAPGRHRMTLRTAVRLSPDRASQYTCLTSLVSGGPAAPRCFPSTLR